MIITANIKSTENMIELIKALQPSRIARIQHMDIHNISFKIDCPNQSYLSQEFIRLAKVIQTITTFQLTCNIKNELPKYNPIKDFARRGQLALIKPNYPQHMPTIYHKTDNLEHIIRSIKNYHINDNPIEYTLKK